MTTWQYHRIAIGATILIFLLSACLRERENLHVVSYENWDNPISITDEIDYAYNEDIDSVIISAGTLLLSNQDLLFIEDYNSTEKIVHVVNIPLREYIGSFGNFGEGPSEILRPGSIFPFGDDKLAVFDYGHWCVKSFDVDSALSYSNYLPQTLVNLSVGNGTLGFPDRFVFADDNWGIGRLIMPNDNGGYSQALCTFNLNTGAIEPFGEQDNPKGFRSSVAVSYKDSVVVEVSSTQDIIRIYDLQGKVRQIIHGPKYDTTPSRELAFFSKVVIGDGKIFVVYSGENKFQSFCGKQVIVFSLNGEYLHSYRFEDKITDMAFSDKYNRLYLSFDGESQFGYLQLGDNVKSDVKRTESSKSSKADCVETKDSPNLTLVDPDNKQQIIPVDEAVIQPYRASEFSPAEYHILLFNQSHKDTINLESISADIKCEIKNIPTFPLLPRLLVSVTLIPDNVIQSDMQNVRLTASYNNGEKQNLSVRLLAPIN